MPNWPTKKLGEVIEFLQKSSRRAGDGLNNGEFPFFTSSPIQKKFLNIADYKEEAIILGTGGSASIHICKNFSTSADVFIIKSSNKNRLENKYLYLFLVASTLILNEGFKGAALKHLSKEYLKNIEIPLPPLEVQKKIVAKLESLLAKVSEAKKLRAEAQENADNLLSAELHKIFEEGKNKGWEEKELGEICELNPKKSEIKDESDTLSVSFIPMAAVDEYSQTIVALEERKLGEVKKGYTYFRDGDVLFAKITPCMENGKVAVTKGLKSGIGFGTTEFHVIRPKKEVLAEWVYSIVRQQEFRDLAREKMTGSAGQKRVPVRFLESYRIPVPSLAEQKKLIKQLGKVSQKVQAVKEIQNTTENEFQTLEQSILSKAFSGELI